MAGVVVRALCVTVFLGLPVTQGGISSSFTNTVCQRSGSGCVCSTTSIGLVVECSSRSAETLFPLDLPSQAVKITLRNYNVFKIMYEDFKGADLLQELNIINCGVQEIGDWALYRLTKLQKINLHMNRMTEITKDDFYHMINLVEINLSNNSISTIRGDAFYSLHNLKNLNLLGNDLNCNCEAKRLKEWAYLRTGKVTVLDAWCANKRRPLFDVSEFGSCPIATFFRNHTCHLCSNKFSHNDCTTRTCNADEACYSRIDYSNGKVFINKGCTIDTDCVNREKQNVNNCYSQDGPRACFYCCLDDLCNGLRLGRRTKQIYFYIPITLKEPKFPYLSQDYNTTYRIAMDNLRYNVIQNYHLSNCSFSQDQVKILHVGPPNMTIHFQAVCTTLREYKNTDIKLALESYLKSLSTNSGFNPPLIKAEIFYNGTDVCQMEPTGYANQGVWPFTKQGDTAQVYCADNVMVSRLCTENGWAPPPLCSISTTPTTTSRPITTTPSLEELSQTTVDDSSADDIAEQLFQQTIDTSRFTDRDINMTVSLLEELEKLDSTYSAVGRENNMVGVMSHILNAPENQFTLAEKEFKSASRLLGSIQKLSTNTSLARGDFKVIGANVGLLATATSRSSFNGMVLATLAHPSTELDDSNLVLSKDGTIPPQSSSWIHLPRELVTELPPSSPVNRVTLAAFKNDKLFKAIRSGSQDDDDDDDDDDYIIYRSQSNSVILSAQIPDVDVSNLANPIEMRFQQNIKTAENATCGYFIETGPNKGHWSSEGCRVKDHKPGEYTECLCDHLTNFALLMDVYGVGGDLSQTNKLVLSYLSYLGCGISLLGLILTLITYFSFRKLRSHNPAKILINLCIAIAATDLIFLAGQQEYALQSDVGCKVVAAFLHFFLLSAMCWMLVEAYYMYVALIQVFNSHISLFMLKSLTVGWGIPLVIVGITLGVNTTNNYGNQKGGICWLNPIPFYASFLAPVAIIIIINFIVFFLVLRQLWGASTRNLNKTDSTKTSSRLRGAVTLVIMLGLTWVFAILAIDGGAPVFQYLFTVFNSLQGLFIFVFHCLLKTDAQKAWKKACCGGEKEKDSKTSKGYSSSNDQDISKSTASFSDIKTDIRPREKSANGVSSKNRAKDYPSYSGSSI